MLELTVTGDTHPKTFTLKTDDADGELARLTDTLEEFGMSEGDDMFDWLKGHSADEFAEGVVIPVENIGEWEEVLEGDWFEEAQKIAQQREQALKAAEDAMGEPGESEWSRQHGGSE